jgi:hypothetical protein
MRSETKRKMGGTELRGMLEKRSRERQREVPLRVVLKKIEETRSH